MDGLGGQLPTQVLADQVILSQPEIVPPTLLLAHPAYLNVLGQVNMPSVFTFKSKMMIRK